MKISYETRNRIVDLLDKQFDDNSTRWQYFEIMDDRMKKGGLLEMKWDRKHTKKMIQQVKSNVSEPGQKYAVIEENGEDVLVIKKKRLNDSTHQKVMILEDSYDILAKVHRELGHANYRQIHNKIKTIWNFPVSYVNALLTSCNICKVLRKMQYVTAKDKGNEAWRFNLLDVSKYCPYIETPRYILLCEDIATEFLILRPMNDKSVKEITEVLMKVFYEFGAPKTLQAHPLSIYNFLGEALKKIASMNRQFMVSTDGDDFTTVIQDSDVIAALQAWIEEVESTHYAIDCEIGCYVVQKRLNTRLRVTNMNSLRYKAFIPHNLFMKTVVISDCWDDDVIMRTISVRETKKRKNETVTDIRIKKRFDIRESSDDSDDVSE